MLSDSEKTSRLDAILDAPVELGDYERFLARDAPNDDYLFSEARARFQARDEDLLRAPADLRALPAKSGVEFGSASLGGSLTVAGMSRASAERLLTLIGSNKTYLELRLLAGSERPGLERLVRSAFGLLLFAPEAVGSLEARVSGTELVRFVGTPYELVREYWENMAELREAAREMLSAGQDAASFRRDLRRLHVIALMGGSLSNFYRPASKITQQGVRPGALYTSATHTVDTAHGTLFASGPRVGVALIGGAHYHALLCAEDPEALAPSRALSDQDGLDWGRVVTGRALDDAGDAAWFCPPRPMVDEHWQKLLGAYSAALALRGEPERAARELARFHYRFVRLHPFRCANQSLSMNLVNWVLSEAKGAGMPHSVLDQLALRLSEQAYVGVFSRAVREHALPGPAAERWAKLRQKKLRAYELIEKLKTAPDLASAKRLAAGDPQAAAMALIGL